MPSRFRLRAQTAFLVSCFLGAPSSRGGDAQIPTIQDSAVDESSGVAASRVNRGLYWTHNDSGDKAVIYAFDSEGRSYGRWRVTGARNVDWEDIAIGPGPVPGRWYLYIGDIGDNERRRKEVVVYRVEEPVALKAGGCQQGCDTAPATPIRLRYPGEAHNAEALLVHPTSGDIYVVSKASSEDPNTIVFAARARALAAKSATLTEIATLDIPDQLYRTFAGGLTGGDVSPDGRSVAFCDYLRVYEASLPAGAPFDQIWNQQFKSRFAGGPQMEAVCFRADGQGLMATSEGRPCPIIELP